MLGKNRSRDRHYAGKRVRHEQSQQRTKLRFRVKGMAPLATLPIRVPLVSPAKSFGGGGRREPAAVRAANFGRASGCRWPDGKRIGNAR